MTLQAPPRRPLALHERNAVAYFVVMEWRWARKIIRTLVHGNAKKKVWGWL